MDDIVKIQLTQDNKDKVCDLLEKSTYWSYGGYTFKDDENKLEENYISVEENKKEFYTYIDVDEDFIYEISVSCEDRDLYLWLLLNKNVSAYLHKDQAFEFIKMGWDSRSKVRGLNRRYPNYFVSKGDTYNASNNYKDWEVLVLINTIKANVGDIAINSNHELYEDILKVFRYELDRGNFLYISVRNYGAIDLQFKDFKLFIHNNLYDLTKSNSFVGNCENTLIALSFYDGDFTLYKSLKERVKLIDKECEK